MQYCVEPGEADLLKFRSESVANKSLIMVNLLRFRDQADYSRSEIGADPCSGRMAYSRYSKMVLPLLLEVGGAPLWMGNARTALIAPEGESWDQVILVAYPSRQAFIRMVESNAYSDAMTHRTAALLDSRLIETHSRYVPTILLKILGLAFRVKAMLIPRSRNPIFE